MVRVSLVAKRSDLRVMVQWVGVSYQAQKLREKFDSGEDGG